MPQLLLFDGGFDFFFLGPQIRFERGNLRLDGPALAGEPLTRMLLPRYNKPLPSNISSSRGMPVEMRVTNAL